MDNILIRTRAYAAKHFDEKNRGLKAKNLILKIMWIAFRSVILTGVSFIILYPLIYMLSITFRSAADMVDPSVVWLPKHLELNALIDSFKAMDYPRSLWNSVYLGLVSSFLQVVSCAIVGYGFARFNFAGKNIFFALAIFTIIVPPSVVYIPTYLSYKWFDFFGIGSLVGLFTGSPVTVNLIDTPWALYIPAIFGVGIRSGLFIYIFRQFYRGLPKELEDAAYIDGSGLVKTFVRIIIPNARAAILTVFLFSMVWYWNDYFFTTMYFTNTRTVSTSLSMLSTLLMLQEGMSGIINDVYLISTRLQAGCLLTILPLLIIYIFLQRYFTEGIERTGLVG